MAHSPAPKLVEIDADTWASSGGTAGMFGKFHKNGTLHILTHEEWVAIVGDSFDPVVRYDGVDQ